MKWLNGGFGWILRSGLGHTRKTCVEDGRSDKERKRYGVEMGLSCSQGSLGEEVSYKQKKLHNNGCHCALNSKPKISTARQLKGDFFLKDLWRFYVIINYELACNKSELILFFFFNSSFSYVPRLPGPNLNNPGWPKLMTPALATFLKTVQSHFKAQVLF